MGRACHQQRGIPSGQPPVASQELRSDGDKEGGPGVPSATGHPIGAAACRFTGVTEKRRQGGWAGHAISNGAFHRGSRLSLHRSYGVTEKPRLDPEAVDRGAERLSPAHARPPTSSQPNPPCLRFSVTPVKRQAAVARPCPTADVIPAQPSLSPFLRCSCEATAAVARPRPTADVIPAQPSLSPFLRCSCEATAAVARPRPTADVIPAQPSLSPFLRCSCEATGGCRPPMPDRRRHPSPTLPVSVSPLLL